MTLVETTGRRQPKPWLPQLIASRRFQSWAARLPVVRRFARRDGERLFDLVSGFVYSQVLMAVVELRILHRLVEEGPLPSEALAHGTDLSQEDIGLVCTAACALGLLRQTRGGFAAGRLGAAFLGVPGLEAMVLHHRAFYRDLENPVAMLGAAQTELSQFWPYVFGAAQAEDPVAARRYSKLMAESQVLVAEETLARIDLSATRHVLDIGGGTGAFLEAVGTKYTHMDLQLFDLPNVVDPATERFDRVGLQPRVRITPGSFRDDSLPLGADTISLIRVLYDHADDTVRALLGKIYDTLPPNGTLIISEPMRGAAKPTKSGDVYFAFYCRAMQTGKSRKPSDIIALLRSCGFEKITDHGTSRPFVTHVLSAKRPV